MDEGFDVAAREGREGAVIVGMRGDLDIATVPEVDRVMREVCRPGARIVLDLRGLDFMDSSGIGLISRSRREAETDQWTLQVIPGASVARVLQLTQIDTLLTLVDAEDVGA